MKEAVYNDEAQLAGWSETHNAGAMIRLWLPSSEALEPFKAMTARKGNTAGQRLALCVVVIADDGTPEQQPTTPQLSAREDVPKGGPLAKLAGQWCESTEFQTWLRERWAAPWVTTERTLASRGQPSGAGCVAAELIRKACSVSSRAELDSNDEAKQAFDRYVRLPYQRHLERTP